MYKMDSTKHFHSKCSSYLPFSADITEFDETTCGLLCQHPTCWASHRRQDMGTPRILLSSDLNTSSSDDEIDLPMQSICNLLSDYGNCISDLEPKAAGGCLSHQWHTSYSDSTNIVPSCNSQCKLSTTYTKASSISKPVCNKMKDCLPKVVEASEIFDRANFNGKDEQLLRKQFYVWVPNPRKNQKKLKRNSLDGMAPQCVLMKNLTECLMPQEISQKRQNTLLKKLTQTRPRPLTLSTCKKKVCPSKTAPFGDIVQPEGFSSSKRKFQSVFQELSHDIKQRVDNSGNFKNRQGLNKNKKELCFDQASQSRFIVDIGDGQVLHHSVLPNILARQKSTNSLLNSSFSGPRYQQPRIIDDNSKKKYVSSHHVLDYPSKITSVSLGLPELPTGVQTTRPFSYRKQGLDLSLGPIISLPSPDQNAFDEDQSDISTTVKDNAPFAQVLHDSNKNDEEERVVHSASPALATYIAIPSTARPSTLLESPPPDHWPLISELSADSKLPSTVLELAPRSDGQSLASRGKNEPGKTDHQINKKLQDETMMTDSPAPPPPSPEPRAILLSSGSPVSHERNATGLTN